MNNEISNDITMRSIVNRLEAAYNKDSAQNPVSSYEKFNPKSEQCAQSSMECLNMLGHAKVNMDNTSKRVENYIEQYKKNPDYAAYCVEFHDSLLERGYNGLDAVNKTEMFFTALKNGKIYH